MEKISILEHHFPPLVAEKYGVNAAILLRDIYHWCDTNRNNDQNFHEGRWWTYQTIKGLCLRHTYWSKNQVEHLIRTCQKKGALLIGHFNENQFDRTCWYALSDAAMALFEFTPSISEISEIDSQETAELSRQNQKCYKDKYITENKANNPIAPCANDPEWVLFDRFWAAYPRKENKIAARRAWRKLNPDLETCRSMDAKLQQDKQSPQWQRDHGQFIPHPSSWLNGRRWEDEVKLPPAGPETPQPLRGEGVRYL